MTAIANTVTVALTDAELAAVLAMRAGEPVTATVEPPIITDRLPLPFRKGDTVEYTGKQSGKTRNYTVKWCDYDKHDGITPMVGLPKFKTHGRLFFVKASDCRRV